jgi:hypothetical protein
MSLVNEFWQILESLGYSVSNRRAGAGMSSEELMQAVTDLKNAVPFGTVPKHSQTIRLIGKGRSRFLISAHESSSERGFWGLTPALLDGLSSQNLKWELVLLHGSSSAGFWLNPADIDRLIRNYYWSKTKNGDYRINAPKGVNQCRKFVTPLSLSQCLDNLAQRAAETK